MVASASRIRPARDRHLEPEDFAFGRTPPIDEESYGRGNAKGYSPTRNGRPGQAAQGTGGSGGVTGWPATVAVTAPTRIRMPPNAVASWILSCRMAHASTVVASGSAAATIDVRTGPSLFNPMNRQTNAPAVPTPIPAISAHVVAPELAHDP